MKENKNAFTLIELLIVIAIIGILATISIFGLESARESTRDSRRKSDLESIRSALEIYRADCDQYPPAGGLPSPLIGNGTGTCLAANVYMEDVPDDPVAGFDYSYTPNAAQLTYTLCSTLEDPPATANVTAGCGDCNGATAGTDCDYRVTNP